MKYLLLFLILVVAACQVSTPPSTFNSLVDSTEQTLAPSKGRYQLLYPAQYRPLLPRAEKFFQLVLEDKSVASVPFLGTKLSSDNILATIKGSQDFPAKVTTYGWWKDYWSAVIAYHSNGTIYLNSYKLLRPNCEIINTLVHEYMHRLGFDHAAGGPKGNARDYSVPYWFGDRAEHYCLLGLI